MEAGSSPGQEEAKGWLGYSNRQLKQFFENECFLFFVKADPASVSNCRLPPRGLIWGPGAGVQRNSDMEAEAPTISPFQELFSFPFFTRRERGLWG